jgi:hypothetical protein
MPIVTHRKLFLSFMDITGIMRQAVWVVVKEYLEYIC